MSKTLEAIKQIQEDFQQRFGVEVKIEISAHRYWQGEGSTEINRELADYITAQFEQELDEKRWHDQARTSAWAEVRNFDKRIAVTVFYPQEEFAEAEAADGKEGSQCG